VDATFQATEPIEQPSPNASNPSREFLVQSLPLVEDITAHVCRRHRLTVDEGEEFAGHVRMKLVERNYFILRQFRQGGNLKAFLHVVIARLLLDFRTAHWGRWRPSRSARRNGSIGVLLDRLITRDGLTFDEACSSLQVNYRVAASRDDLYRLSVQLPYRPKRRLVSDCPETVPATYGDADRDVVRFEAGRLATRVKAALKCAAAQLLPAERQLLDLRYREGLPVVEIARLLGETPKPLYRRLAQIVRKLAGSVHAATAGVAGADADAFQVGDVNISW
jgi:RNA polymerase sigma factor (sigma-70 family)